MSTSSSSTVTSVALSSFNCSSENTATNVDCTIQDEADTFSGKDKYKNDVSTFSLCLFQMTFQMEKMKSWWTMCLYLKVTLFSQ